MLWIAPVTSPSFDADELIVPEHLSERSRETGKRDLNKKGPFVFIGFTMPSAGMKIRYWTSQSLPPTASDYRSLCAKVFPRAIDMPATGILRQSSKKHVTPTMKFPHEVSVRRSASTVYDSN